MFDSLEEILEFELFQVGDYCFTVYYALKIILFFTLAKLFLWLVRKALDRQRRFKNFDPGSKSALLQIISYIVWVLVIVFALDSIGVKVTILIAGSAALLVGIGLGLQQTFNDIFSGIILLIEGSIKVDDVLKVGDDVVRVKKIGLRTSIVENRSEITYIMPNSRIVTDLVVNWSYGIKHVRFPIRVGVAYGTDVDLVINILQESAREHPLCDPEREPFARLVDFGDSSLEFEVQFWSEKMFEVEQTKSDIRRNIVRKFMENGVVIPFPQRDLHFKSGQGSSIDPTD